MATLTPTVQELLTDWLAGRRWYRGQGTPQLRRVGGYRLEDPHGEVGLEGHLVVDASGEEEVVYQVPLTYRAEAVDFLADALVGVAEHDELGTRYVYDATADPVFVQTLLQHVYGEVDVPSLRTRRLVAGERPPALRSVRVLSGEQSNTSVVVEAFGDTRPVVVKLFRVLQPGENPDVTVTAAIAPLGNRMVPGPTGYAEGRWSLPDGTEASGHLALVQEFLPDTRDAWQVALESARDERDPAEGARALGAATARVHASLRDALGTRPGDDRARATLLEQLRRRAAAALAQVPELGVYRDDVEAVYAGLEGAALPDLQRVHGDLHLGQVLEVPGRGWVLLDFEGEPMRPLAERTAPDLALRDVAGMLRSFDYAAASVAAAGDGERSAWAASAREAYLQGYAEESGTEPDAPATRALLDALELDKALYEVVYEAHNRPDWVPIPVAAVERLVGGRGGGRHAATEGTTATEGTAATGADPVTGSSGAAAPRVGRHRAPDPQEADMTHPSPSDHDEVAEAPTAADFGVVEAAPPASGAGSLVDEDGQVRTAARAEEGAATPPEGTPGPTPTGPAGHGADEGDEADEDVPQVAATPTPTDGPAERRPAADRPVRASGGLAHGPLRPPAEMLRPLAAAAIEGVVVEPHEPPPAVDRNGPAEVRWSYPGASGSVPALGPDGRPVDPETLRAQAWSEALTSPAVVTGRAGDGAAEDEHATPGTRTRTVRRVPVRPPADPPAPHTRPLDLEEATDVSQGLHRNPHHVLGPHLHEGHVTIRTVQPAAEAVSLRLDDGREVAMTEETGGIWVAVVPQEQVPDYRLAVTDASGRRVVDDAYRHRPQIGELDLHLIGEGRHEQLWTVLGSHVRTVQDGLGEVTGTHFAVWAPNALAVHVIGDFNGWDGAAHALHVHESVGVWEIFVPGVGAGAHYKYDITGPDGTRRAKADPLARATEVPPFNNSVVTVSTHAWGDAEWMERRARTDVHHGPMSVYEVHLASWRRGLSYEELADQLVSYVAEMGFTHVELMPVMQHPYGPSWGYHVTGYYAADSRFGHEDGLRHLIDRLHQAGVGVILDWVPGHFATDPWALARFDGTPIYEHPDPRKGWHPEWGSYIFDFGRPEVRNFLVANATYWLEEFHADGLRVDGVASMLYLDYSREPGQWIPNRHGGRENLEAVALLQETNATAYRRSPGVVMIAEESTSWPGVTAPTDEGGLGFGFKWNMGWMHDTLDYLARTPYSRAHHHHALTFSLVYAFSEKYVLPISHDEVVHGKGSLVRKMAGDPWQKFATTRAFLAYQWSHPGKQLLFMGSEFAQEREWADGGTLSWELTEHPMHGGVQHLVRDLNRLYDELPALWQIDHHEDGFAWLDANDASRNLYSYLRWGDEGPDGLRPCVAVVVNFSGVPQEQVHVGLPYGGRWREVLNTDAAHYGGSGQGNLGAVEAYDVAHHRQPFSALVTVPPMAAVWLVPDPVEPEAVEEQESEEAVEAGRHPRAGQPAQESDLVDVEALLAAYAEIVPDPDDVDQQVAFGTSGHRGSSLDGAFNEHHILATTQAICEYRADQGIEGPLFLGKDTHALSGPAWRTALEVLVGNGVDVWVDHGGEDAYTPTPAVSRAILAHNREVEGATGTADGIVVTPSHNPPRDGGFKYNPPHGGPADTDATGWIAERANALLRAGLEGVRRVPFEEALGAAERYDFMGEYVRALPRVVDLEAIREAGVRIGAGPLGGASVDYWQHIADEHGLDLTVVNPQVDPTWRFMTLDRDGKIRMDCSSPDAMASILSTMETEDGRAFDLATGNDADADRHGIVTPDGGLMNPNHYLAVAIDYLVGGGRPGWPETTAVGKTLVSSSMIDRVVEAHGRELLEVPVGFKWFVPGLLDGSIGFGGEESAGASLLCRDGSVWTTDKDGIVLALLAAEIIARTGKTPSQRYAELVAEHGDPAYARVDAPADRAAKDRLKRLTADDITAEEIAGEPVTAVLTEAPGNGAAIGGLKVTTRSAWFAARPSGTEDVYKIYAESFRGPEHLAQVQAEAQQVVDAALEG